MQPIVLTFQGWPSPFQEPCPPLALLSTGPMAAPSYGQGPAVSPSRSLSIQPGSESWLQLSERRNRNRNRSLPSLELLATLTRSLRKVCYQRPGPLKRGPGSPSFEPDTQWALSKCGIAPATTLRKMPHTPHLCLLSKALLTQVG